MIKPPLEPDAMKVAIMQMLKERMTEIINEEAQLAAGRAEKRVRALCGEMATQLSSWVDFQTLRNELRITVRFPDKDQQP